MNPFRGRRGGRAYTVLTQHEARLLANLAAQVAELVRDGTAAPAAAVDPLEAMVGLDGPAQAPDDPVLRRLLPDAYRDDPEGAADFRRFTEQGLRETKVRNAQTLIGSLEAGGMADEPQADDVDVDLDADQVQAWLRSLTDIRLALATRLGITDDDQDHWSALSEDDPAYSMHAIYDWLGFVQESLVLAID
jgi:hypothetical protein